MEVEYICSPNYFQFGDVGIDAVNSLILILLSIFAFYSYNCVKSHTSVCNKRFIAIGSAFLILAIAFIIKTLSDYYLGLSDIAIQKVILSITSIDNLYLTGGFLLHRILTILAILILFILSFRKEFIPSLAVVSLVILNTFFFIHNYIIFYTTTAILLFFIGIHYFKEFDKNHNFATRYIAISFILLAVSYILFSLVSISPLIYIFAKVLRLLGFLSLLVSFYYILNHGKKKK